MEERIERLENDYARSMNQIARSLNEMESEAYDQHALINAHSKDLREIRLRVATVETRLGAMEARLNSIDEKLDAVQAQQQQMSDKIETLIDLLTKRGE